MYKVTFSVLLGAGTILAIYSRVFSKFSRLRAEPQTLHKVYTYTELDVNNLSNYPIVQLYHNRILMLECNGLEANFSSKIMDVDPKNCSISEEYYDAGSDRIQFQKCPLEIPHDSISIERTVNKSHASPSLNKLDENHILFWYGTRDCQFNVQIYRTNNCSMVYQSPVCLEVQVQNNNEDWNSRQLLVYDNSTFSIFSNNEKGVLKEYRYTYCDERYNVEINKNHRFAKESMTLGQLSSALLPWSQGSRDRGHFYVVSEEGTYIHLRDLNSVGMDKLCVKILRSFMFDNSDLIFSSNAFDVAGVCNSYYFIECQKYDRELNLVKEIRYNLYFPRLQAMRNQDGGNGTTFFGYHKSEDETVEETVLIKTYDRNDELIDDVKFRLNSLCRTSEQAVLLENLEINNRMPLDGQHGYVFFTCASEKDMPKRGMYRGVYELEINYHIDFVPDEKK